MENLELSDRLMDKMDWINKEGKELRKQRKQFEKISFDRLKEDEGWKTFCRRRKDFREELDIVELEMSKIEVSFSQIKYSSRSSNI